MSHAIETAMYLRKPAWHGLGIVLDHPPTVEEAIKAAGLDWVVEKRRMAFETGPAGPTGPWAEVDDRFAIVRTSDGRYLGHVGAKFKPLQSSQMFAWFQPFLDAGLVELEAAGSLHGGKRVWVLARIKGDGATIVPNDRVEKYLLIAHAHDGSIAIHIGVTPTRVVCQNTLSIAIGSGKQHLRIRHTKNMEEALAAAHETIERANMSFDKAAEVWRALAGKKVDGKKDIRRVLDVMFPKKEREEFVGVDAQALLAEIHANRANEELVEEILDSGREERSRIFDSVVKLFEEDPTNNMPGVEGTGWGLYNAFTGWVTHGRGRSQDNRLSNAWLTNLSDRALQATQKVLLG